MPGGNKNIKPSDNPKPFKKGDKAAEKWTEQRALDLGNELIEWFKKPNSVFFEDFLIIEKGLYRDLIGNLSKRFSTFADLIKKAKEIQELKLVKGGISADLQPTLTIFCLKNHHNYKDKTEIDTNQTQKIQFENVSKQFPDEK